MSFSQYIILMTYLFFILNDAACSMTTEHTSQRSQEEEDDAYLPLIASETIYKRVKRNTVGSANTTECLNLHSKCGRWKNRNYCDHKDYKRFMEIKCRLSCELCKGEEVPSNTNPACDDLRKGDCDYWLEQGYCVTPLYEKFMTTNCKRSCGLCPEPMRPLDMESITTPSPTTSSIETTTQDAMLTTGSVATTTVGMTTTSSTNIAATTEILETLKTPVLTTSNPEAETEISTTTANETNATPVLNTTSFRSNLTVEVTTAILSSAPTEMATLTSSVMSTGTETIIESTSSQTTSPKTITLPSTTSATTSPMLHAISTSATTSPMLHAISTVAPSDGCLDVANLCRFLIFLCPTSQFARTYCKKTCGVCSKTDTSFTTTNEPQVSQGSVATSLPATTRINDLLHHTTSQQETTQVAMNDVDLSIKPTTNDVFEDATIDDVSFTETQTQSLADNSLLEQTTVSHFNNDNPIVTLATTAAPTIVFLSTSNPTAILAAAETTSSSSQECADEHSSCDVFPLYTCTSSSLMQLFCKRTCGLCQDLSSDVNTSSAFATFPPITLSHSDVVTEKIYFRTTTSKQPTTSLSNGVSTNAVLFRTTTPQTTGDSKPPADDCVDQYQACPRLVMHCDVNANVTMNCRRTCGKCGSATTEGASPVSITTQTPCEDTFSKCSEMLSACGQTDAIPFLKKSCRKTCGFCSVPGDFTTPTPIADDMDCYDTHDVCGLWAESGFCDSAIYPQMRTFMQANCRKSCRSCSTAAWSEWSECSLTCGGGQQKRMKMACHNDSCGDPITEQRACAMVVCPKHPGSCEDRLSARACQQYKDKNACGEEIVIALCAATCLICRNETALLEDGGRTTSNETKGLCIDRHQRCGNWSARGFCERTYSTYMEKNCPKSCRLCHVWKPWSQWTPCNATCGGGVQTRNRTCTSGQCVGESVDTVKCNSFVCHSCRNQVPGCNIMKVVGKCQNILYKVVCKETCGLCVPPPMKGRCADTNTKCTSSVRKCGNPAVAYACPVTCKKCAPPVDHPTVATSPPYMNKTTSDVCADQHDGCPDAFAGGHCSDSRVSAICPHACGQCTRTGKQPKSGVSTDITCANQWEFCDRLVEGCANNLYIQQNCPVACNVCSTSPLVTARPSAGACIDLVAQCPELAGRGGCRDPTVAEGCKVSCQHPCTLVKKKQVSSQAAKKCVDQHSLCGQYHAIGKCENEFIKFLCPASCQACDDDERSSISECRDAFGAACLLYASKCTLPFIREGCTKTCGLCGGERPCKDVVPNSCVALAGAGMCKILNFREKCPVSCKTCTPPTDAVSTTSDKSLNVPMDCVDTNTDCDELLPFCETEPSVQASCRMTCGLCAASITEDDLRCIDINPRRCSQVAATDQCRGRMALMCSKSCGRCRPATSFAGRHKSCADTFSSCNQKSHLCRMRSVWERCKRTCGKCFLADQEGTSAGTGSTEVASDQGDCKDHVDDCQMNKDLCLASDSTTRQFMRRVCPETCGACETGSWTAWGTWSECSQSCNGDPGPLTASSGGNRTRTRQCPTGNNCAGEALETGKCNKDRCPGMSVSQDEAYSCVDLDSCEAWSNRCTMDGYISYMKRYCPVLCGHCQPERSWTEWGECSVTCGSGVQTRNYDCLKTNCTGKTTTETKNCTKPECPASWTSWSSWTPCLSSCGSASRMRMRSCLNTTKSEEETCPGAKMEEEVCAKNPPCPAWTTWSVWATCSVSCGEGNKTRTRVCNHATNVSRCEGNATESEKCLGVHCPRWSEWHEWRACSVTCGGRGFTRRFRTCLGGFGECGDKKKSRDVRSCGGDACPVWQEWTKWTDCSVTCGSSGKRERNRICEANKTCDGESKEIESCSSDKVCNRWKSWSQFSLCSVTCGNGVKTRTRSCTSTSTDIGERKKECPGKSKQSFSCSCNICPDVGTWTNWGAFGECSVTCGTGKLTRRRICLNGIPNKGGCKGSSENIRSCKLDACLFGTWTEWEDWTRCSASCGGGLKTKNRTCVGGVAGESGCPGENEIVEKCNDLACPTWSSWRSWADCSATCGSNGTRTRSKVCYDAIAQTDVSDSRCAPIRRTRVFEACNTKLCPTWGEWGQWGPCSRSCRSGVALRSRKCLNGAVGSIGCEMGYNETKKICSDWDCPSTCQSINLEIHSQQSQNTMTYSTRDVTNLTNTERLHCFARNDSEKWLQINFDSDRSVSEISMEGYYLSSSRRFSWVRKFKVWYSNSQDGEMQPINDNSGQPRTFTGPEGSGMPARRRWDPISARYWRIEVVSSASSRRGCMRIELFGCDASSSDDVEGSGINPSDK